MAAVRTLAEAHAGLAHVRSETERELAELQSKIAARLADAEAENGRAYAAAVNAGWSQAELRHIGFTEPTRKTTNRRRPRRTTSPVRATNTSPGDTGNRPPAAVSAAPPDGPEQTE